MYLLLHSLVTLYNTGLGCQCVRLASPHRSHEHHKWSFSAETTEITGRDQQRERKLCKTILNRPRKHVCRVRECALLAMARRDGHSRVVMKFQDKGPCGVAQGGSFAVQLVKKNGDGNEQRKHAVSQTKHRQQASGMRKDPWLGRLFAERNTSRRPPGPEDSCQAYRPDD